MYSGKVCRTFIFEVPPLPSRSSSKYRLMGFMARLSCSTAGSPSGDYGRHATEPSSLDRPLARPAFAVGENARDVVEDRGGLGREVAPELGEHDAATAALEQRLAELVLEGLDLPAQRRLRDAEPPGRARDVLLLRHGDEVVQL